MKIRPLRSQEWKELRDLRLRALAESPHAFYSTLAVERTYADDFWQKRASDWAESDSSAAFVGEDESGRLQAVAAS